jgi:hypothetical protein
VAAPVATPELAIEAHHLRRASTASTFTMPQSHPQPMGQANFNSGFAQPDIKTDPSYSGQRPMHQNQAPMLQVQTTYTYNSQHETTFNTGQSYGAQLPMTPIQNTGYQAPSQFQNGLSMQVPSASQPVMQMADLKLSSLQPQYNADASPPPPPYTAPSNPKAYPQYQSTDEKSVHSSASTINMQQNFDPPQPSAPQVKPPESYAPPVTAMGAPPRTPSIPNAQELPAFSTASPPSARAAPVPSLEVQPPQHQTNQALSVTTQHPVSNIPLQQFSMMSINPSSTPAPSYAQPSPQLPSQLQQYTNPSHQPQEHFNPTLQPQYQQSPYQQPLQYPNSPISPLNPSPYGYSQQQQQQYPFPQQQPQQYSQQQPQQYGQQQPQPYSPQNAYGQPSQGSRFLSVGVGVGIPSGIFGGRNGAMGSAMAFATPPAAQNPGMAKKKSFRNLGGFLW